MKTAGALGNLVPLFFEEKAVGVWILITLIVCGYIMFAP